MVTAKEMSIDGSIATVLSELGSIFTLKETCKNGTEGFSRGHHSFALSWIGIGKNSIKHNGAQPVRGG